MNKDDTKVADIFTEDINKLTEHLNIVIEAHNKQLDEIERLNDKLNDTERRIDKAIEYIQNNMQYDDNIDDNWVTTNALLNILQGSEEDESN